MVAILTKVPREFVVSLLGTGSGLNGILRATLGGVLLDLCSHGILMVGAKLYERGVSTGQVMAFLIASPWEFFFADVNFNCINRIEMDTSIYCSFYVGCNSDWASI